MDQLTKDTIQTIERLHSAWIDLEVAGEVQGLLAFCAEDIELRPPDGPSVYGRDAVLAHLVEGTAQIHSIEISDRHICESSEGVSLTANYRTTFSLEGDPAPRQAVGSHRWELRKQAGRWQVFLVSWSSSATTDQPKRQTADPASIVYSRSVYGG
jgi:ketosteroid isomerase-like protein